MTRIAGAPNTTVPKAAPRVRSSPKPHYVKPPPAPKPKPVATSVHSGNNPRGTVVIRPKAPSKTLTTSNNPRGHPITAPVYVSKQTYGHKVVKVPKALLATKITPRSSSGGGFSLAAITPGGILHTIEHVPSDLVHISKIPVIHNTLKDVENLVPSSIEGVGTLAQAVGHDLTGVAEGALHVGPGAVTQPAKQHSDLKEIAEDSWKQSIYHALLVDHSPSEAAHMFAKDPLNTALEVTGGVGLVGRLAGVASRAGVLGSTLHDAAGLARDDRVLIPGVKGEARHYHPNLIVSAGQHLLDANEDRRPQYLNNRKIKARMNDMHGITRAVAERHEQNILDEQAKAIKGDHRKTPAGRKAAAHVASYVVQGVVGGTHERVIAELHDLRTKIKAALGDKENPIRKTHRKVAEAHIKNIDTFLADPDVAAVREIAQNYADRQRGEIDPEMVNRGLLSKDQALKARLVPYVAAGHMADDNVRVLTKTERTVRAHYFKQAKDEADKAAQVFHDVKLTGRKLTPQEHSALRASSLKAERALNQAAKSERYRAGQLEGRYDRNLVPSERSNPYITKVNEAKANLQAAREAMKSDTASSRDEAEQRFADAKQNMKDARDQAKDLKQYEKEKLPVGTVVKDVRVGMRKGKPVYAVRRVPAAEIERHMVTNGKAPGTVAYVNLTKPREPGEDHLPSATNLSSRGDSAIRSRTAREITTGNWKPGHTALADSQVGSMRRIDRAKGYDNIVKQVVVHDKKGRVVSATKDTIDEKIEKYAKANPKAPKMVAVPLHSENAVAAAGAKRAQALVDDEGNHLTPQSAGVSPKQRFGMAPAVAMKQYKSLVDADRPSTFGSVGVVTRAFRNTVLPFSTKWLVGNVVEAALRSVLVGAGPGDANLFRTVVKTMRDSGDHDSADTLEAYANGQHYSMAQRANTKMTGAGAMNNPPPHFLQAIREFPGLKQAADSYHGLVQKIYGINHKIETGFSHAVGGAHMRQQLHEFGHEWTLAATHQDAWMQKLAQGYADPMLAQDAGRFIQQTLGKYDRFSPGMKKYINNIAPFAPWYWNALRFVYVTMPALHPLAQSVLLSAAQSAQAQYAAQDAALGKLDTGDLHSDLMVGGQSNPGYLNLGRFTPWSAPENGPSDFITSQIAPQIAGAYSAAKDHADPFGNPLKDANGDITNQSAADWIALNTLIEPLLGPVDVIHRAVADQGRTEWSGSTLLHTETKPGTAHGAFGSTGILAGVNKVFNPLQPTYLSSSGATGSTSAGGLDPSGGSSGALNPSGGSSGALNPSGGSSGALNPSGSSTGALNPQ